MPIYVAPDGQIVELPYSQPEVLSMPGYDAPHPLAHLFPTFGRDDLEYTRNVLRAQPLPSETNMWDIPAHERDAYLGPMAYRIRPETMQRLFGAGDRENVFGSWAGEQFGPGASWTDTNYWPEFDRQGNLTGFTVKTGAREGTFVPYTVGADGRFVPDFSRASTRGYETNDRAGNVALGLGALGLFGPALLAGMGGAAPAGGTAATSGGAAAGGGTAATSGGAAAGGAAAGGTAATSGGAAAGGAAAGGVSPWLPSNAAAGAAGAGGMSVPAAGMSVPAAGMFGTAAPTLAGAAPGLLSSAASGLPGLLSSAVNNLPSLLGRLAPSLIDVGAGMWQNREARQAQEQLFQQQAQYADAFRQAGERYAGQLAGLIPGVGQAFRYAPATVDTGIATSRVDPETGRVGFGLAAPYQQARDAYLGAAANVMQQAQGFAPRRFAQERFAAAQGLLRPQDELAEQNLMQQLYQKGGFGLTLNQPGATGGTVGVNPYLDTLLNARNRRDAQMAYDSLAQGENYLDNLLRRQSGLFSQGMGVDVAGRGALDDAMRWGDTFNRARQEQALRTSGMWGNVYGAQRDAVQDYIRAMLGAETARTGANAVAGAERTGAVAGGLRGLPWGYIFRGVRNWLGS